MSQAGYGADGRPTERRSRRSLLTRICLVSVILVSGSVLGIGAGAQAATTSVATDITAQPAVLDTSSLFPSPSSPCCLLTLTAKLTDQSGSPVPGETIWFSTGFTQPCTAVTDSKGVASCSALLGAAWIFLSDIYTTLYQVILCEDQGLDVGVCSNLAVQLNKGYEAIFTGDSTRPGLYYEPSKASGPWIQ